MCWFAHAGVCTLSAESPNKLIKLLDSLWLTLPNPGLVDTPAPTPALVPIGRVEAHTHTLTVIDSC